MRNAWSKIARRIDCIAGRSAERHTECPYEKANHQRAQNADGTNGLCANGDDDEYEYESADDFRDEIGRNVADCRACTEDGKLEIFVFGWLPMRQVGQINQNSTRECTKHLCRNIGCDFSSRKCASRIEGKGYGRIEMACSTR